ncbi:MAG: cellulase family glycosylhydrolase, partial [Thermoleophilia bacterium]|nr:cellulase family glycosylhydrolase [Thermoleophilia bacterium]
MKRALVVIAALASLVAAQPAGAAAGVRYGIQDDAWLLYGPGTLDSRLATLDGLGVDLVRFTIDWNRVEPRRGERDWGDADRVLAGLRGHGLRALVTLYGTPRWANGGRSPNWAPTSGSAFGSFAAAAAKRYPWVKDWLIWNEPNQRRWLRPTIALTYVTKLLNPAYAAIHRASGGTRVGGGATAPRGSYGGVSPVQWIRGMRAAHARLDAYAHHPYPIDRFQTPWTGACGHCETITMASLERLQREVGRAWGNGKRIWLTEFGYQTSPPDRMLGVPP